MASSNPDLSSVLRTLSAFANPASTPQQHHQHQYQHQHERPPTHPHTPPTHPSPPNPISSTPNLKKPPAPASVAANITTYPLALKHIMHLTTQNASFSARIQHLIKSQREHERTWWKAREALIEKQAARKEKRKRIEEVLKSVGASNATASNGDEDTSEKISQENATELRAYDSKVYQASVDMARVMESELRRLGVPFFCIDRALIISTDEGDDEKGGGETTSRAVDEGGKKTTKISKEELEALKRRVLDLLVDLCS